MGEADLRAFDLSRACLAAEVPDDLDDVGDAGGAERVALGEQAAAGVDRDLAADLGRAFVDQLAGLALAAEAEVLVVQELGGGEAVVQLDLAEVLGADAGLLVGFLGGARVSVLMSNIVGLRSCYGSDVRTEAATQTGFVVNCFAFSADIRTAAAAPSPVGQHM